MKKIIAGLLALMLIVSLAGCGTTTTPPTAETTAPAVAEAYTEAAAPLRDAQNLKVALTTNKDITADGGTFSSVSEQELTLTGIGTDAFAASLNEELKVGELKDKFTEHFANNVLYVNIYDIGYFQGEISAADFQARFAPAVLLDEALYADVSSQETESGITLSFCNPSGPESWALPQGATFLNASGTAQIGTDGTLAKTVYTVEYQQGRTTVSMEVTAEAQVYTGAAVEAPQNIYQYNKIETIEVPRLFDTALLYLNGSETASSTINQTLICQAAGYTETEQTQLHYTGVGTKHQSIVTQTITAIDNTGAMENYTATEEFRDGQYTRSNNGGAATPDASVNANNMLTYMQGFCTENIPALNYIASTKLETVNGLYRLEMELNPKWGQYTSQNLCYQLFQDSEFLDKLATNSKTTIAKHYMFLDPGTGFPLSIGTGYAGTHTIDGQEYTLAQEITQSFQLADSGTYKELTGELPAETAPADQATPLLYKVTGANGQEMYLMGTIHVGDAKTGFLPQAVYDAFNASDALAVEADIVAFEKQMETDPQLALQVATVFTNTSGKATKDMLDAENYETAVKLLTASGEYNINMELMNPFVWTSSIEDFYLSLGKLSSEKGMDMRLLKMAKDQDKKILEVESAMFQYEMLAGFSQALQVMELEEVLETNAFEFCQDVQELYDLWCAGDEAALRQMLGEEDGEMTAEEQALYEEYTNAMIIDRNDGMLDVAISYLESDETVFYAVGLAHLLQENGLVDTLREAGYTVEQIIYN